MGIQLKNNASGTLATAVNASDTGIVLTTGNGASFPALSAGDYFYATLESTGGTSEIIKVTVRSGDSLTVVRAQEGTTAQSFAAGSRIELRVTAQSVLDAVDQVTATQVSVTPYGWIASNNVQGALQEVVDDLGASSGSSLLGFLQAGANTIARTVQSKLRETVSVKDFGAVGDGIVDDAPAFRAALDYVNSIGGGGVFVPEGTYLMQTLIGANPFKRFANLYPEVTLYGIPTASVIKAAPGLSTANQWNFFVLQTSSSFESIHVSGLVFDYNGNNNLVPAPPGTYRPCLAVWVIAEGSAVGKYIEVSHCIFKDNPGANSISCVDNNPTGGINSLEKVFIHHNIFVNFGYLVGNSANVNNNDHSCIYVQSQETIISDNFFAQDFTASESIAIGMSAIDFHSAYSSIVDNVCNNVHTFVSHQTNVYNSYDTLVANNICFKTDRLYAFFDGGSGNTLQNLRIVDNVVSFPASNRLLPCVDLWSATAAETIYNVVINGNQFRVSSGSIPGKNTPTIKVRRADNLEISNNFIWDSLGIPIHYVTNADTQHLFITNNTIGNYGVGGVAGSLVGIKLDTTGATGSPTLSAYIKNNSILKATLTTREAGISFNGPYEQLVIDGNDIIGATKQCTTSSFNVTTYYIRRGKIHQTDFLNFAAPSGVPGQVSQTVTVAGARVGDLVKVAFPGAMPANFLLAAYVTATNTVVIQWTQIAGAATDPDGAGGYYVLEVDQMGID